MGNKLWKDRDAPWNVRRWIVRTLSGTHELLAEPRREIVDTEPLIDRIDVDLAACPRFPEGVILMGTVMMINVETRSPEWVNRIVKLPGGKDALLQYLQALAKMHTTRTTRGA